MSSRPPAATSPPPNALASSPTSAWARASLAAAGAFLHRFGEVLGGLILGALYFALLGPVALASRLASDPLRRRPPRGSAFLPWARGNDTLAEARRQG